MYNRETPIQGRQFPKNSVFLRYNKKILKFFPILLQNKKNAGIIVLEMAGASFRVQREEPASYV